MATRKKKKSKKKKTSGRAAAKKKKAKKKVAKKKVAKKKKKKVVKKAAKKKKKVVKKKAAKKKKKAAKKKKKKAKKKVAKKKAGKKKKVVKKAAKKKKKVVKKKAAKKATKKKVAKKKATARAGASKKKVAKKKKATKKAAAPVLWKIKLGNQSALGIFVDDDQAWIGHDSGHVVAIAHDGKITRHFKLPRGVKALVSDERWLYAGCDDGNVYDLRDQPFVAYKIKKDVQVYWMDLMGGALAVSDDEGGLTVMDHEGELLWKKKSSGDDGWMVRCDASGLYHGHDDGVTKYNWHDGSKIWDKKVKTYVLFGWQEDEAVYAGTGDGVESFAKEDGQPLHQYKTASGVPANACSPGGEQVFAAQGSDIVCFDGDSAEVKWRFGTKGIGGAMSMQFHDDKLYIVTTDGCLACIDCSDGAVAAAQRGVVPKTKTISPPKGAGGVKPGGALEKASAADTAGGVTVECFTEGSKLRVRPVSSGYQSDWRVQFPRDLREDGAKFVVEELVEASQGGFYRAVGKIKRL